MAARKAKSIQAEPRRGNKSGVAKLQATTLRKAHRNGYAWDDDEVARLVTGIQRDETTFDIAMSLGRSYYGVAGARAHVAFAMRHAAVLRISK